MTHRKNSYYWSALAVFSLLMMSQCGRKNTEVIDRPVDRSEVDSLLDTMTVLGEHTPVDDSIMAVSDVDSTLPVLRYTRGACFGRCPVYSLEVYLDGRLRFDGKMFTKRKGQYTGILSRSEMAELIQKISDTGFERLHTVYPIEEGMYIPDLPNKEISVQIGEQYYKVLDNHSAPEGLKLFENWVEQYLRYHPSLKKEATDDSQ